MQHFPPDQFRLGAYTPAGRLLGSERSGVAIDFLRNSAVVRDWQTPANNYVGTPAGLLTYTSPSAKNILGRDGFLASASTIRCEFDASGNPLGVLIEEARTNLCLQASDLTNASWTKTNLTTAKTATGPDGVANSATTITATAGNATALQAITSGSAARITSVWLKRRTGTGNIDVTQDNGTTWATQTLTSSWARYSIASVTSTNPTVGIRVVTNGDEVDVAFFQHELGAFITSPIATTTATVTRAVDNITLPVTRFGYNQPEGAVFLSFRQPTLIANSRYLDLAAGATRQLDILYTGAFGQYYNGTASVSLANGPVANQTNRFAAAYKTADWAGVMNGGAVVANASATVNTSTNIYFGNYNATNLINGYLQQVVYLPRRVPNVDLQAWSAV